MTATSARSNHGVKRYLVALVAVILLTLTACAPPIPTLGPAPMLRPPKNVTAVAGDGEATVTWVAPNITENLRINGYTLTSSEGDTMTVTGVLHATMTGLTNGTAYTFTVVAFNDNSTSPDSEPSNEVTPTAG
jgi:hypothetical protein